MGYERRTDTRTYEDRRKLYEGGWEVVRAEHLQALWKEKYDEWLKRPKTKLPKWFGERPGKRLETQSPLMRMRREVQRLPLLTTTLKKKKRRRKRKRKKRRKKKNK